jgi:hypothetical protein
MAKWKYEHENSPEIQLSKANDRISLFEQREKVIAEVWEKYSPPANSEADDWELWQAIRKFMEMKEG